MRIICNQTLQKLEQTLV